MDIEGLMQEIEKNDIIFKYEGNYYSICFFNGDYSVYETEKDESEEKFNSFQEMIDNWIINGEIFKNIIKDIELI